MPAHPSCARKGHSRSLRQSVLPGGLTQGHYGRQTDLGSSQLGRTVVVPCFTRKPRGKQVVTITEWLASFGLAEYAQRFAENDIDESVLRT